MAGQLITFATDVTLVAATANEVLQIKIPANFRGKLRQLFITGQAAAGGTDPVTKGRLTYSTANFGTFTGTVVKAKANPANAETIQSTFSGGADGSGGSTRPTTPTDMSIYFAFNPQGGINVTPFLPEGGLEVPGGTTAGAINVELTSGTASTPTLRVTGVWEE